MYSKLKPTTRLAGVGCLLFSFACSTVMFPAYISGSSMAPTIQNSEWALIVTLPHQWIKHGDVITLQSPSNANEKVIKRLIAKEGDTVQNRSGEKLVVPKDHLWIEGDNEEKSLDSNHYGPVHKDLVTGVAKGIVYPFNRVSLLSRTKENRVVVDETNITLNTSTNTAKHIFSMFRDLSNF